MQNAQRMNGNNEPFELHLEKIFSTLKDSCCAVLLNQATLEINNEKKGGVIQGTCHVTDFQNTKILEPMYQACALLGLNLFPYPQAKARLEVTSDARNYHRTTASGKFELNAEFLGKESDSNRNFHRIICHFNVSAQKDSEMVVTAKMSIMVIAPKIPQA